MIGAAVARGNVDAVIFLGGGDPQTPQPHDLDIGALLGICEVTKTPIATTVAGAPHVIEGVESASCPTSDRYPERSVLILSVCPGPRVTKNAGGYLLTVFSSLIITGSALYSASRFSGLWD
jgi:hypothetical protein